MGRSSKKQARRSQSGKVNAEDLFEEEEPRTAKRKSGKMPPADVEPEEKRVKKKKRRSGSGAEAKMPAPRNGNRWVAVPPEVWVEDVAVSHLEVAGDWSTGDGYPFVNRVIGRTDGAVKEWEIVKMPRVVVAPVTPGRDSQAAKTPVSAAQGAKQGGGSGDASTGKTPASEGSASLDHEDMRSMAHRVRPRMMESIQAQYTEWELEELGETVEEGRYETDTFPQQQKWWHIRFEAGIKAGFALAHNAEVLEFLEIAKGREIDLEEGENQPTKIATWEGVIPQRVQTGVTVAFGRSVRCLCGLTQSLNHIHQCKHAKMHYAFHRGIIMRYDEVQTSTSDLFVESLFPRPRVKEISIPAELLGYFLSLKKEGSAPVQAPNVGPELDVWAMDVIAEMENRFFKGELTEFAVYEGARLADRATGGTFMQGSFPAVGAEGFPRSLEAACTQEVPALPHWLPWTPVYLEMLWWKLIQDRKQERIKRSEGGRRYRSDVLSLPVVQWAGQDVLAKAFLKKRLAGQVRSRWIPGMPILKKLFRWGYNRAGDWNPRYSGRQPLPCMAVALKHPVFPFRDYGVNEQLRRGIYRDVVRSVYHEERIQKSLEELRSGESRSRYNFGALYEAPPLEGSHLVSYRPGSPKPEDLAACYGMNMESRVHGYDSDDE